MNEQKWAHIRILILTAFQETEKAIEVLQSGADSYLLKCMHPRELAETIRLVYRGGMLIDQDISNKLLDELETHRNEIKPAEANTEIKEYGLTTRELEILQLLSTGLRYKTIASKLYLSDGTVRNYASTLYVKLGVRNREEAVSKALEAGLL